MMRIHFRGKPINVIVQGVSPTPIECIPIVYSQICDCGVGIVFQNNCGSFWGLAIPKNIVAAWRATEILQYLDVIQEDTLCATYYAGLQYPNRSDYAKIQGIVDQIGIDLYREIMDRPVPEEIIRVILDGQNQDDPFDLWPLIDEVSAGTVKWRQEFADAGMKIEETLAYGQKFTIIPQRQLSVISANDPDNGGKKGDSLARVPWWKFWIRKSS